MRQLPLFPKIGKSQLAACFSHANCYRALHERIAINVLRPERSKFFLLLVNVACHVPEVGRNGLFVERQARPILR